MALRVNPSRIERLITPVDLQEPSSLRVPAFANGRNRLQLFALTKGTIASSIVDDIACHILIEPGDVAQKRHAGGIEIHADMINAGFDHFMKRVTQESGGHVVLIQTDADMLRLNLNQFSERVL